MPWGTTKPQPKNPVNKMVMKKSEYQNQFRSSVVRKHHDTYLENLQLRHQRRDREFLHTPICWGELNEEDEDPSSSDSNDDGAASKKKLETASSEPKYQSLAEILSDSKNKADAYRQSRQLDVNFDLEGIPGFSKPALVSKSVNVNNSAVSAKPSDNNVASELEDKNVGDKSYSIGDLVDEENKKLNEKLAKQCGLWDAPPKESHSRTEDTEESQKDAAVNVAKESSSNLRIPVGSRKRQGKKASVIVRPASSSKCPSKGKSSSVQRPKSAVVSSMPTCSSSRLRRPDRKAEIPRAKPRPASSDSDLISRPPFLAYGAGDVEESLSVHRTHNVLATKDVYVPALKAKTRREEERKILKKKQEAAKNREALLNQLAAIPSPREEEDWRSEYKKQFHAYDIKEYERALSARAVIPHCHPIRAVHRGGCLVVHVD